MNRIKKVLISFLYLLSFILWFLISIFCLITFSSIGFIITIFLLVIISILLKKNYHKVVIMLPLVVIPVSIVGLLMVNNIQMLSRWNEVKADYEFVNQFVIDYYENNCSEECYIYLNELYNFDKVDLSVAINNISNYQMKLNYHHQGLSYIKINSDYVKYISSIDAQPDFFIIYSRNGKSYSEHHFDCYYNECNSHLTGRWYQNNYEHHI